MERELRRDDVEKARREGYGISDPWPEKASHRFDRQEEYRRSLTKRQREKYEIALYGRPGARTIKTEIPGFLTASAPTEGCMAEAQGELYGDCNRWFRVSTFVHTRFKAIGERTKADPKYIGVTRDWQTCMAKKGYAYKDFSEVTHDSLDKFSGRPEKKREEIRLAVDDAECDRQVGRSKVHRGLFDKYTQAWAKQNEANVIAYRDLTAQAVQRAKPLV
ncbi:hypothetical protein GCM10017673_03100 [Streptosporangium violaceochromogenes]|nr:hypothetical protein GCM10017673_03100 [Streptosporangium violaceochromogenes]